MNKEKTAMFIGHKECYGVDEELIRKEIGWLICCGVTEFLNGGMGDFDIMCARMVKALKPQYPHIQSTLVIPYLTFKVRGENLFDSTLYPEGLEKYHFKAAIPARNKWMVENSRYALCYVDHDWGGAAKTYEKALAAGLEIVNIGKLSVGGE